MPQVSSLQELGRVLGKDAGKDRSHSRDIAEHRRSFSEPP